MRGRRRRLATGLPFTPVPGLLGFVPMPLSFYGWMLLIVASYIGSAEAAKRWWFHASCAVTILALIFFGYFKSKMTGQPVLKGTFKVAMTGIVAAAAAYLLAKAVS